MMSLEISEMKSSFIAISFCKTRCLPTAGFVLHPPKLLSSGPHQGVMRLDSISSLKFVEPAQGAHVVRRKQRRQTRHFKQHSKLKKECEIALYRHDPERFTKALRPRLPSCHPNDNQYQPHQNPPFGDVQQKAVC
jgi:hypothetical protein